MNKCFISGAAILIATLWAGASSLQAQDIPADNGRILVSPRDKTEAPPPSPENVTPVDNGRAVLVKPDPKVIEYQPKTMEIEVDNRRMVVRESMGGQTQCNGCTPVSRPSMNRGAVAIKYLRDNGKLPASLIKLSGTEIDALLRGKSWSSADISGKDGAEHQRLLAFDNDNRGRWLNFIGGGHSYSTLCQYSIDENLLCLSCNSAPAQCSSVFRDEKFKDFIVAWDPERDRVEIYDWILPSRWEDDRFIAPK